MYYMDLPAAADVQPEAYYIVEVSPDLQDRQQALIAEEAPQYADRVFWLDRMPGAHRGVIIANEVLDALPVERFLRNADGVRQLRVAEEGGEFVFVDEPAPAVLVEAVRVDRTRSRREAWPTRYYVSEVSLAVSAWTHDLSSSLEHGVALLFDYGVSRREYYAPDRNEGWLRCHFRHRAHSDPLILAGIQDLTAWVDFTAVAGAATDQRPRDRRATRARPSFCWRAGSSRKGRENGRDATSVTARNVECDQNVDSAGRDGREREVHRFLSGRNHRVRRIQQGRQDAYIMNRTTTGQGACRDLVTGHRSCNRSGADRVSADLELGTPRARPDSSGVE